jgi:hypothetical protein
MEVETAAVESYFGDIYLLLIIDTPENFQSASHASACLLKFTMTPRAKDLPTMTASGPIFVAKWPPQPRNGPG